MNTAQHPSTEVTGSIQAAPLCEHCLTPVPAGRSSAYCCAGCEVVAGTLRKLGLTSYYELREQSGAIPKPAKIISARGFTYFDDPTFVDQYTRPVQSASPEQESNSSLRAVTWYLAGIHCAACVWILERLPELQSGVARARVEFSRGILQLEYDTTVTSLSAIATLLQSLGYPPAPVREGQEAAHRKASNRVTMLRIGVAAVCTMNIMMMAVSLYQGEISGIDAHTSTFFSWVSLALAIPVVTFSALPFYRTALGGLRGGVLHIDLPIALAVVGGFIFSVVNTVRGSGSIYYDSVSALVLLLLAGRWLQHRSIERVTDASNLLYALAPRSARIAGTNADRFVESLVAGEQVEVLEGESIPVDGVVSEGAGYLTLAILTGESAPAPVRPGMRVFAGSPLTSGAITVTVEATGRETRLGRLLQSMERAAHQRAPLELFLDRVSRTFIAAVLVLAGATFYWWAQTDAVAGFENAVALLVVSCPCVLAVATPLTFSLSIAQAAKKGILLKSAEAIERVVTVKNLCLDKTGTLTTGQMSLSFVAYRETNGDWRNISSAASSPEQLVTLVAQLPARELAIAQQLELESNHPIAATIRSLKNQSQAHTVALTGKRSLPGIGVEGSVGGELWRIGAFAGSTESRLQQILAAATAAQASVAVLTRDGAPQMVFACSDQIRSESLSAIAALKNSLGMAVEVLSGDRKPIVTAVAQQLGISPENAHGEMSPEDKQRRVQLQEKQAPTAMVGDGVNDAAALTSCSVGIGVHGGAEVCLAVADVYLTTPGLTGLVELFEGARRTIRVVKRNLVISATYNLVGAVAAMAGLIGPLEAAVLMPISSLSVISIALLSRKF